MAYSSFRSLSYSNRANSTCHLFLLFGLLLLSFRSSLDLFAKAAKSRSLATPPCNRFILTWPIAYGRRYTGIHFYRAALETPQERLLFFPFIRQSLLGVEHLLDPANGAHSPPWMLHQWLPANHSGLSHTPRPRRRRRFWDPPSLSAAQLMALDTAHGALWLEATATRVRHPGTGATAHLNTDWVRERWEQANLDGQLRLRPAEYFRFGSEFTRRQLPLGEWLAEAGITPDDHRSYARVDIERALAAHLGGGGGGGGGGVRSFERDFHQLEEPLPHFRLLCLNMDWAEVEFTPLGMMARTFVRQDHGPATMLYSVEVCTSDLWRRPEVTGNFVPCPERWEGPVEEGSRAVVPCEEERLFYYRTMNDGIERPFHEAGPPSQEEAAVGQRGRPRVPVLQPAPAHLFQVIWPPAYGRYYTSIHYYREGLNLRTRPLWLNTHGFNVDALRRPDPVDDPEGAAAQPPSPSWMLFFWLPSNYSHQHGVGRVPLPGRAGPALTDARLRALDTAHGLCRWFAASITRRRNPLSGRTTALDYPGVRALWQLANHYGCALRYPHEYFRQGSAMLTEGHLPLGRWLAEAGIVPDDTHPYARADIERVLEARLARGGSNDPLAWRYFRLLCVNLNWAEWALTPANDPFAQQLIRLDHGPPNILHSVVVCVDRRWAARPGQQSPAFVICPEEIPFINADQAFCEEAEQLWYVRTINDGIRLPFDFQMPGELGPLEDL